MAAPADAIPARHERPLWRSRTLLGLALLCLAWLAAWVIGSRVAGRILTTELESRFAARVRIGSLQYWPPYWLVARDVALTSELGGAPVDWLRLGALHARLEWLPFADGSVRLADVAVVEPTVNVVRDADGVHDVLDLWRDGAQLPARLPVREVDADGARLLVEDRATPSARSWPIGPFALRLRASDPDGGTFGFTLAAGTTFLDVATSGTVDVARRTAEIADLAASLHVDVFELGPGVTAAAWLSDARANVDLGARTAQLVGGSLLIGGEPPLTLDDVHATLTASAGRLDASAAGARFAGGTLAGTFAFGWADGARWQLSGDATDLQMAQVAPRLPVLGGRAVQGTVSGRGSFSGVVTGDASAWLDALRGEGSGRARAGRFNAVPLVAKLLEQSSLASQAGALSNAAARFRLEARAIHLDDAAIGSATVGLQGQGDIGLDGNLGLEMVVVPLGSWRASVARRKVPLVGGALASLAGTVQSLVGKASAEIYQYRVVGTVEDPRLVAVAFPGLTKSAASAFSRMVGGGWEGDVLGGSDAPR